MDAAVREKQWELLARLADEEAVVEGGAGGDTPWLLHAAVEGGAPLTCIESLLPLYAGQLLLHRPEDDATPRRLAESGSAVHKLLCESIEKLKRASAGGEEEKKRAAERDVGREGKRATDGSGDGSETKERETGGEGEGEDGVEESKLVTSEMSDEVASLEVLAAKARRGRRARWSEPQIDPFPTLDAIDRRVTRMMAPSFSFAVRPRSDPLHASEEISKAKALKKLGITDTQMRRDRVLRKMGLTEEALARADVLFSEQRRMADGFRGSKPEWLTGYSDYQLRRAKALRVLGATEEVIEEERAVQLSQLGISSPPTGPLPDLRRSPAKKKKRKRGNRVMPMAKRDGWVSKRTSSSATGGSTAGGAGGDSGGPMLCACVPCMPPSRSKVYAM
eukprot:PLAT11960.1.p1 GENE.PLAT11960.1~~PLAT11960.1.p1  ORF type:complete len:392 (+),score=96.56 PLAT11960.1:135-1310(+)